jgi:hypothetical protein
LRTGLYSVANAAQILFGLRENKNFMRRRVWKISQAAARIAAAPAARIMAVMRPSQETAIPVQSGYNIPSFVLLAERRRQFLLYQSMTGLYFAAIVLTAPGLPPASKLRSYN